MTSFSTPQNSAASQNKGVGLTTGQANSLSPWAGDYVTNMLGRGQALGTQGYQAYGGPLTAGASNVQQQAFNGIAGLALPSSQSMNYTPQQFNANDAQRLMNPYLQSALNPQIQEAQRQSQIQQLQNNAALTKAGALGGGRGVLMDAELQNGLSRNLSNIVGQGYNTAYNNAQQQFNTEQQQNLAGIQNNQNYGLAALSKQAELGNMQRAINQEGINADLKQFQEERDYPYKQVQYMQSLLQNLPIAAQSYSYSQPSTLSQMMENGGGLMDLYKRLFPETPTSNQTTGNTGTTTPAK